MYHLHDVHEFTKCEGLDFPHRNPAVSTAPRSETGHFEGGRRTHRDGHRIGPGETSKKQGSQWVSARKNGHVIGDRLDY